MTLRLFLLLSLVLLNTLLTAQVGINSDNSLPDPSAGLDVKFTDKGLLPPRMTFDQRNSIQSPAEGLMVFCTNCSSDGNCSNCGLEGLGALTVFQGGKWVNLIWDCPQPNPPTPGNHIAGVNQITWNWNTMPISLSYKWNTSDNYFTATEMGNDTTITETGLNSWTTYTRYVWAYNDCDYSGKSKLSKTTLPAPFSPAPSAGVHVATNCQIIWSWSPVYGATNYRWNTVNDYVTSIDIGTGTTKTEIAGGNIPITRYLWAQNGTSGLSEATILTCQSVGPLCVGQNYGGGVIFYIDGSGQHGLISATSDQSTGTFWGCKGNSISTSTAIGAGQANSTAIINNCCEQGIAARICNDLVLNGYDDWFLPSKDELILMYGQRSNIGGFASTWYWSSSEVNSNDAYVIALFGLGSASGDSKYYNGYRVRAIRAF